MKHITFLFVFTLVFKLYSENEATASDPFTSSLVSTQSLLPTAVQSVSVISGEWLNFSTDLTVIAPEPLSLNRTYFPTNSHLAKASKLGSSWDFNREQTLKISKQGHRWLANYKQATGVITIHRGKSGQNSVDQDTIALLLKKRKGLTNCRMGEISGRTNLNNTFLLLDPKHRQCTARSGNGNITYYRFSKEIENPTQPEKSNHYYVPLFERKANGNLIYFKHGNMKAYNPDESVKYGSIEIFSDSPEETLAQGSDGRQVRYLFNCKREKVEEEEETGWVQQDNSVKLPKSMQEEKKEEELVRCTLSEVICDHKPPEKYEYENKYHRSYPLLKAKHWPDSRFQSVEYYQYGDHPINEVDRGKIESTKDFRYQRVSKIFAPVGTTPKPIQTHRFIYHGRQEKDKIHDGKTDVYDAYGRKMSYEYNPELRPTRIKRFDREGHLYSLDYYLWDDYHFYPDYTLADDLTTFIDWGKMKILGRLFGKEPKDLIVTRNLSPEVAEYARQLVERNRRAEEMRESETPQEVSLAPEFKENGPKEIPMPQVLPIYRGLSPLPKKLNKWMEDYSKNKIPVSVTEEQIMKACLKTILQRKEKRGNLKGKYLQDAQGNVFHAQYFSYDRHGNVLKEEFIGNLSGTCPQSIQFDGYHYPRNNGIECYRKRYTYTDDGLNLLLTEEEDNGRGLENVYCENSSLIKAKYVKECGRIIFRQFYFYDANTTLIRAIKDDGSGREVDDLTGMHERQITLYEPRKVSPYGLPEMVEERYWENGEEKLLKKKICHYSQEGLIEMEEHFDANGQLIHPLTWRYNPHGREIEHVNALGEVRKKDYDANDNLIYEEELGVVKLHTYDYANRLIRTVEHHPGKTPFAISHRYDYIGNKIATVDRYGNETQFEYDDFNRLVKTLLPPISEEENRSIRPTIEKGYDEADRLIFEIDPNGYRTSTQYNSRGAPIEVIHPDGTIDRTVYALDGSIAEKIAPNGTKTIYRRDCLGRILEESIYNTAGDLLAQEFFSYQGMRLKSETDAEGKTTTYHYDGAGWLIEAISGKQSIRYQYDASGRISKILKGDDQVQTFFYDQDDRVEEERQENSTGDLLEQTFFAYDERSHVIEIRRENRVTRYHYNSEDQLIETIDGEGHATHIHYNESYLNAMGQFVLQIIETDPIGRQIIQIHNAHGHLIEVGKKDPFGTWISHQNIIVDATGRTVKTIDAVIIEGQVDRHLETRWSYHPSGQEEMIIEAVGTPLQKVTRFLFNPFSQKEQVVKPSGTRLYYFYDALGRNSHTISSDRTIDYYYSYNRCHQLTAIEDALTSTKTVYEYDIYGHLKQEKLAHNYTLHYTYDTLGRIVDIILPDSTGIRYQYNGHLLQQIKRIKQDKVAYTHTYNRRDLTGHVNEATLPNAAGQLHYQYDRNGRLITQQHRHLFEQVSGYDPAGRMIALSQDGPHGKIFFQYQYNALDHLISEQGEQHISYQTDSLHNRLAKNGLKYSINVLNQLEQQGDYHYKYDRNGNLIEKECHGEKTHFVYDAWDRLISTISEHKTTHYVYDGLNRRISKIDEDQIQHFLYEGQNEIGSIDTKGNMSELRLLGTGIAAEIGATIAIELNGNAYVPLHNIFGHITALIDANHGDLVESYHFTAFGEETIYNPNEIPKTKAINPWRFASKRVDAETGWIFFGKRYYDPSIGRWTTPDPATFVDGPNLYSYLHHNPIKSYDAYGLFSQAYEDTRQAAINSHQFVQQPASFANEGHWADERPEVNQQQSHYAAHERQERDLPNVYYASLFEPLARAFQFCTSCFGLFESNEYRPSNFYQLGLPDLPDNKKIIFINGINTSFREAQDHALYLSDLAGGCNIYYVYNATHGLSMDLTECEMGMHNFATKPTQILNGAINYSLQYSPEAELLLIFHSQGGIHTTNTLLACHPEKGQRVHAVGIASARYVYSETCQSSIHYRAEVRRDPIAYLDGRGGRRERNRIVTLKSHPNAPLHDHSFQSPTYHDSIISEIDKFINKSRR